MKCDRSNPGDSTIDRATLDRLVREHLPAAVRFATRLTGDLDTAEEVVQEALFRAARSKHTFRGDASFRTWLLRIVINAFRDQSRGNHETDVLPDEIPDPRSGNAETAADEKELGTIVAKMVAALPPRQREVLVLIAYEGLSLCEVAALLQTTEGNVRTNLHLGRKCLRERLAPYLEGS